MIRILSYVKLLLPVLIVAFGISCSLTTEEISTDPSYKLRFSTDTIFFDTLFSEIPSFTQRLKVYNDHNEAVNIASIALNDPISAYELVINGITGTSFESVKLAGKDSLLVLLQASIENRENDYPYIVEDVLKFSTNGNLQDVIIISWGQDANYLKDSVVACNTVFTPGKPYVIYDHLLVDSLCTLTIEPGVRIFSHFGSQIFVKGSLLANGTADSTILFTNDRFDSNYQDFPGQWGGITFLPGSHDNTIRFAEIRNPEFGIWLGTPDEDTIPDLVMENTIISNSSESAVLAFTSDLEMTNCLLHNGGQILFGGLAGGHYNLRHNTIVNYGYGFFKAQPTMYITNALELSDGSTITGDVSLNLGNNIIWGNNTDEIILENSGGFIINVDMTNNLFRTSDSFFEGHNNKINDDPLFADPPNANYQLQPGSPAIQSGADLGLLIDLSGNPRTTPPDIGCYEKQ